VIIWDPNNQYEIGEEVPVEYVKDALSDNKPLIKIYPKAGEFEETFNRLIDNVKDWDSYVLLIDETNTIQTRARLNPGLEWVMRQSPDDVDSFQTTHRPYDTQRLVRALATDVWFFQNTHAPDLDVIRQDFGEIVAREVARLGQYQCLHYWIEKAGKPAYSVWRNPEEWYVRIRTRE